MVSCYDFDDVENRVRCGICRIMATSVEECISKSCIEPIAEAPRLVLGSIISVAEKEDSTTKEKFAFEINLGWFDGTDTSDTIIFRDYQEFYNFHRQLLDSFPQDAGSIKGSKRIIPFLPRKQIFRRNTKNLALQRVPKLHEYLQEMLKLPDHILFSDVFLNFFRDNWEMDNYTQPVQIASRSKCIH